MNADLTRSPDLRSESSASTPVEALGPSLIAQELRERIGRAAGTSSSVLIVGEPGSGQESIARAIHELSDRRAQPFFVLNCSALPEAELEFELFGHVDSLRSSLLDDAEGGSIFLDEVQRLGLGLQARIFQLIRQQTFCRGGSLRPQPSDVRVLAGTESDLTSSIELGRFRKDLYFALAVLPIVIPPLRHRPQDLPDIANHLLNKYSALNGQRVCGFCPMALEKLVSMNWEGNLRELESVIERLAVLSEASTIQVSDIPNLGLKTFDSFFGKETSDLPPLEELERRYIRMVLQKTGSHKERAAQILGINRRTLYRKEREYGFLECEL